MSIELVDLPLLHDTPTDSTSEKLSLKPHSFPALTSASGTSSKMPSPSEIERESIVDSLHIEEIDPLTYRSTRLWIPINASDSHARQGQALDASQSTSLTSSDSTSALGKYPIIYRVEKLRDGKSYVTRSVTASQHGQPIFMVTCSFTLPTPARFPQPSFREPMPLGIPLPMACQSEEERWTKYLSTAKAARLHPGARHSLEAYIMERDSSPVAIREVPRDTEFWFEDDDASEEKKAADKAAETKWDGSVAGKVNFAARARAVQAAASSDQSVKQVKRKMERHERMLWMKAKDDNVASLDNNYQKSILAYLSDFQFIGTAAQATGLSQNSNPKLGMMASLDHVVYFYSNDFKTSNWLLHVITSPRVGDGRGVVEGRFYTEEGELVALTVQEGVVRATAAEPKKDKSVSKAKL
ncbi:hypothetical protein QFC21_002857 [Naganishia friedmannii]|uniref:Uncharacterized protein n=1 Tax=Naganishia friedmannii TaxID=89922 RepID=A0ACC2VSZ4_9TREE|nr:hypothetical protein QFC21_002857 [Naganishia friedmannii]